MGFWIFVLIMNLLIPFTMIGIGNYFFKKAPDEINSAFGYRTPMSTKNKDTWNFAHHYCGKLWRLVGWIMLAVSIVAMLLVIGSSMEYTGIYGSIFTGIQVIIMFGTILPIEMVLRKEFDKEGNRRIGL